MRLHHPVGNFHQMEMADRHDTPENRQRFRERVKEMPYEEFVKTEYWKLVSAYVLHQANYKCRHCGQGATRVHHVSYEHHGEEHLHLEDLHAICGGCHRILHTGGILAVRRVRAMTPGERMEDQQRRQEAFESKKHVFQDTLIQQFRKVKSI